MATKDPWAAFNPQAEGAVAPLIPRTPAPQTGPQAQADVLANQKTEAEIRTANATANITEHKASEEATIDQKQQAAKLSAIESADQLIGAVKRARSLVSGWSTGVGGAILDHIPATQAAQLDTIVNQEIRGNIFLNRINALKEENPSPTGGTGIGRIMQAEIPLITGSIGALDPVKMGRKGTLDSLDQIEARTLRTKAIINGENPDDPAVQKKYHIPALPTYGAGATPPGATGGGDGNQPGGGGPGGSLSPEQSSLYDAWFKANPHATPEQLMSFGHSLNLNIPPENARAIIAAKNAGGGLSHEVQPMGFLDNAKNDVAGIAQGLGMLGDAAATGAGKVLSVVPTALGAGADALGLDNAGRELHGVARSLANPPTIGATIENVAPTPDSDWGRGNRFVGQLVGGALGMPTSALENVVARFVGDAPKAARSVQAFAGSNPSEIATALQDEGIPAARPIADPSKRASMAYLETTPGGNNIVRNSLDQTRRSIADKVSAVAGDGTVQTPGAMGETVQSAGKRTLQGMKERARGVYTQADQVASGAPVHPTEALAKLDGYIAQLSRNPETNSGVVSYLQGVRNDLAAKGGKTVGDIRDIITGASDKINFQNLQKTRAEAIMSDVNKSLNSDVSRDLGANNPQALDLYNKADGIWRGMSNLRQQVVKKLIGPADNPISGEAAMSRVSNMMNNKGDLGRFKRVINMMDPEERRDFAATLFGGIGQRSAEEPFSPAYFLGQTKNMQPEALKTVFGAEGAKSIQNLRVASQGFKEAAGSLNNSRSGQVMNWKGIIGSILSLKSSGAGLIGYGIAGYPGAVAAAVGTAVAQRASNALSAKALMNPEVSQWIRKVATAKTDAQARVLMGKLNGLGAGNAALQSELSPFKAALANALNDNAPRSGSVAASPDQRPDQQQ
jgi:hypothetical protein